MRDSDGSQEVKTVFCTPNIAQAEVQIVANMDDGGLVSCHRIGDATQTDNVINGTNG
jgi:hypothetical protein